MVQYKVITAKQAMEQLQQIVNYLLEHQSVGVAQKVSNGILDLIKTLEKMPHRHPILQGIQKKKIKYRYVTKWSYKIVIELKKNLQL